MCDLRARGDALADGDIERLEPDVGMDWTLDPNGMVIHITGSACTAVKNTPNAVVEGSFCAVA